ncbi:protein-L-isoaspartate O-methyltransferase family protein [Nocardioides sp. GXZ039]|uniref:protein-L-isoaspartate O-methyltransferase family protein n=1 Tax=Nocardioides sp. GXZ039 TaxID=3136018 RepID=UPI0030F4AF60
MSVDAAFEATPREWFLPPGERDRADHDGPIPIGHGATNSQPRTVAAMLGLLDVQPGQSVLDVGSGSGWTTALLAWLVGPTGRVLGLELEPDLVRFGRDSLARTHRPWARIEPASDTLGRPAQPDPADGGDVVAYDRILVSAAATALPDTLLEQLTPTGVLVVPVRSTLLRASLPGPRITRHGTYRFVPLR